jgi:hypothetical protein
MLESLACFKQKTTTVKFKSQRRELTEGDIFCFKMEMDDDDVGDVSKYFNEHHFVPSPSVSLDTSKIESLDSIPPSIMMGGRNICSLMHNGTVVSQPPTSLTYQQIMDDSGYVKIEIVSTMLFFLF